MQNSLSNPENTFLAQVTPEMEEMIKYMLRGAPETDLCTKFNIQINRKDVQTLRPRKYVNDEIINFYLNMIVERGENASDMLNVFAFSTFFYPQLKKSGYNAVKRHTRKVDIFSKDLILVPIFSMEHWSLVVIDFRCLAIRYYDSMLASNNPCLNLLLRYIQEEHLEKKECFYDTDIWSKENVKDIPMQINLWDCGVFVCKYSEHLSRGAKMTFTAAHMPDYRKQMIYEICTTKLLT